MNIHRKRGKYTVGTLFRKGSNFSTGVKKKIQVMQKSEFEEYVNRRAGTKIYVPVRLIVAGEIRV